MMKRKHLATPILTTLFVTLFFGCEKPVKNFDLKDHDPKLVLNTILTVDSSASVQISRSADLFDINRRDFVIKDASLSLIKGGTEYPLIQQSAFEYRNQEVHIMAGSEYTLEAQAPGYPTATSTINIPTKAHIKSIKTSIKSIIDEQCFNCSPENYLVLHLTIPDEASTNDYYQLQFYIKEAQGQTATSFIPLWAQSSSPYIQFAGYNIQDLYPTNVDSENEGNHFYLSDQSFNGTIAALTFNIQASSILYHILANEYQDTIPDLVVRLSKISEDLYLHLYALANANNAGDFPLTEPVYIPTNITNGLGILGAKASNDTVIRLDDISKKLQEEK